MNFFLGEQYLPLVVPLAFSSCNLDDGSAVDIDGSDVEAHCERGVRNISLRTGVLDEKAAATQALGLFGLHTNSSYALYPFTISFIYFLFLPRLTFVTK